VNSKKIRIGIVFGGQSGEHEVSLKSALSVMNALDQTKYAVVPIGITEDGKWLTHGDPLKTLADTANTELLGKSVRDVLNDTSVQNNREPDSDLMCSATLMPRDMLFEKLDILFPVLHGPFGEDGTIQGLFEMAQIPYVGCGVLASAVGMDKILFKAVMAANEVPYVPCISVLRKEIASRMGVIIDQAEQTFGWPVFCKPANMGSSVGITMCHTRADLKKALLYAARFDRRILVEQAIVNAREIELSVLGNDDPIASVPGEIVPSREFYDYEAKYIDDGDAASGLLIPAKLEPEQTNLCREYAIRAFKAIDGSGMSRIDFLLDPESGKIYLNEVNTIPGFTSISMYAKLWEASGISYPQLIDKLIELALERFQDKQINSTEYLPID